MKRKLIHKTHAMITVFFLLVVIILSYFAISVRAKDIKSEKIAAENKLIDANIGNNNTETLSNYLQLIPNEVTTLLGRNGWSYIICDSDELNKIVETYGKNQNAWGLTVYENKVIYVSENRIDTVIHESWHAIDSILELGDDSERSAIYKDELRTFLYTFPSVTKENSNTVSEYFAEAFQRYILCNDVLESNCPETYQYIHNIVQKCTGLLKQN